MRNDRLHIRVAGLNRLPPSARRPALITRACRAALGQKPRTRGLKLRGELNIVFLDKGRMRPLNRRFLRHDRDTDVLAFNYDAYFPGEKDPAFGDVFVSTDKARTQARALGRSVLREVLVLVAHGTLHLLGYDDKSAARRGEMSLLQERIVGALRLPKIS